MRYFADWHGRQFLGPNADLKASGLFVDIEIEWGSDRAGNFPLRTVTGASGRVTLYAGDRLFDRANQDSPLSYLDGPIERNRAEEVHGFRVATDAGALVWMGSIRGPVSRIAPDRKEIAFEIASYARYNLRKRLAPASSVYQRASAALAALGQVGVTARWIGADPMVPPYNFAAGEGVTGHQFLRALQLASAADAFETRTGEIAVEYLADAPETAPLDLTAIDMLTVEQDYRVVNPPTDVVFSYQPRAGGASWSDTGAYQWINASRFRGSRGVRFFGNAGGQAVGSARPIDPPERYA